MGYKTQYSKICDHLKFKEALSACDDAGIIEIEARKFKRTSCDINF